jgi:hypothetical protein
MNDFGQSFSDPIIYTRRKGDSTSPYLEIKELIVVINSKALLTEIPNKLNRVTIIEQVTTGNGDITDALDGGTFTGSQSTINSTVPTPSFYETDGIPSVNQYSVDYNLGIITFHPSQEGSKFVVSYLGQGSQYVPASRVYTLTDGNQVTETLDSVINNSSTTISNIQSSINNANTATINANNASSNYQNLINQQLLIYQPSVPTYSAISSAYPTPQLGWTTVAKDTGIRYRYNNYSWVDIGNSNEGDGFTVVLSATPPANTNVLWVNVPSGNSTAKVVQSATTPTDTSVIWWQP